MEGHKSDSFSMRLLSFANDEEDPEKAAKLREAAAKMEKAMAKEKALSELIDYPTSSYQKDTINPENDCRSLYERLQEQKSKKQELIDEANKLSNYVAHLDEDDVNYLDEVAKNQREAELRKRLEIQDALEAKKRLDEQKMLDGEKRRKESLLGKTTQRDSRTSKSRLHSMIKVKSKPSPKGESGTKSEKDDSSACTNPLGLSTLKRPIDVDDQDNIHTQKKPTPSDRVDKSINYPADSRSIQDCEARNCECPKDVAKIFGVLPSSLIVSQNPRDSEDSDNSDDDLNCRLIPKGRTKQR